VEGSECGAVNPHLQKAISAAREQGVEVLSVVTSSAPGGLVEHHKATVIEGNRRAKAQPAAAHVQRRMRCQSLVDVPSRG